MLISPYVVQDSSSSAIVEKALARPDQYVLKPQREGGGGWKVTENVFGFYPKGSFYILIKKAEAEVGENLFRFYPKGSFYILIKKT